MLKPTQGRRAPPRRRVPTARGELYDAQRARSAAAWQAMRSVSQGAVVVVGTVFGLIWGWNGGFYAAGLATIALADALSHRVRPGPRGPFLSHFIDTTVIGLGMGIVGVPRSDLGIPLAYIIVAAALMLPWTKAAVIVGYAAVLFALVRNDLLWFPDPGLSATQSVTVGIVVDVLFGAFLVSIVLAVFRGLVRQSARNRTTAAYQHALSRCSAALLGSEEAAAVSEAAGALLEATSARYVYVEEVRIEVGRGPKARVVAAVPQSGRPGAEEPDGHPVPAPRAEVLRSGLPARIDAAAFTDAERRRFDPLGIRSSLAIPILIDGEWAGTITLADTTRDRWWSKREFEVFETAAAMIGTFWARIRAHRRLTELLASKDEFVASVSHELRTPLTAVVGLSAELDQRLASFGSAEVSEFVRLIAGQAAEVAALVDDLLVAARADSSSLVVHAETVDATALVAEVLHSAGFGDREIGVRGSVGPVRADPTRVRQILRNLLTNAFRYGGDTVWVELDGRGGTAVISVCDDGPGVPEPDREAIFEPYRTGHHAVGQPASVGLGLSVARKLALRMGGDVVYRSGAAVTAFDVTLPLADPVPAPSLLPA